MFPATHAKSSAVFGNHRKNIVESFQNIILNSTLETVNLPDLPDTSIVPSAPQEMQLLPNRMSAKQKPFPLTHKLPLILVNRHPWKYFCRIL